MMSGTMNSGPRGGGRILLQQVPHVQSREAADADEGAKVVPSLLPTAQVRFEALRISDGLSTFGFVCCDLFAFDFDDNTCLEQGRTTLADQETLDTNMLEAYTILDSPIPFTSAAGWKNVCLQHYERLAAQTTIMATKYLAFCNVCEDDLVAIDRSRRNLPTLRILYDSTMELLIVKLMVGKAHEWATNLFCDLLRQKVQVHCGDVRALCTLAFFNQVSFFYFIYKKNRLNNEIIIK
jgi:hypothetical protein